MDPGNKIWNWDLEFWPGEVFGPKMAVGKTWFCEGMVSEFEIRGYPMTQMDCMVSRRPLGEPVSSHPPPENGFTRIYFIWGKLRKVPLAHWAPCTFPISTLWAYMPIQLPNNHPRWPILVIASACVSRSLQWRLDPKLSTEVRRTALAAYIELAQRGDEQV